MRRAISRGTGKSRVLATLLGLDVDASSITYVARWSQSDQSVLSGAATNLLHAVNTIAAGLGLDETD